MSYFSEQDGLKHHLECRWNNQSCMQDTHSQEQKREFPIHKTQLIEKYCALESLLNVDWHPDTNLGAAIQGNGLLTDHGVDHVNAVMYHANDIIGNNILSLNGYEIYLLLLAIHFHDLGNIYGRDEHEKKIDEVIDELGDKLPLDNVEKEFVEAIAKAHGGYVNEDKDTIRYISVDETCNGVQVRTKILAALLRFADEISDDFSRAVYKKIKIPQENQVFHAYSETLEPVSIKGETIKMHFRIPFAYTQHKLGKGNTDVYLYDEICNRLAKCMRELEYCRKYANGFIKLTTINVTIDVSCKDNSRKLKGRSSFRLKLLGYPDEKQVKLEDFVDGDFSEVPNSDINFPRCKTGLELKKAMKQKGVK